MERKISNPVFTGLNEKQFNYLVDFKNVYYNEADKSWVEIYRPFTMDELNEIFDELEKLEDDPIITRLMGLEVVCGGRLGKIINISEGYECAILYANREGVVEHVMALREEDTHVDAILRELED